MMFFQLFKLFSVSGESYYDNAQADYQNAQPSLVRDVFTQAGPGRQAVEDVSGRR